MSEITLVQTISYSDLWPVYFASVCVSNFIFCPPQDHKGKSNFCQREKVPLTCVQSNQ